MYRLISVLLVCGLLTYGATLLVDTNPYLQSLINGPIIVLFGLWAESWWGLHNQTVSVWGSKLRGMAIALLSVVFSAFYVVGLIILATDGTFEGEVAFLQLLIFGGLGMITYIVISAFTVQELFSRAHSASSLQTGQ